MILLDVVMPDESGIDALPKLQKEAPLPRCSCSRCRTSRATSAKRSGRGERVRAQGGGGRGGHGSDARGAAGNRYLHPALGARLDLRGGGGTRGHRGRPLSDREREILRLLALGHTNQEIAKMLHIGAHTEAHRSHIMQKLRLKTRAELVRYALANGLLAEDS